MPLVRFERCSELQELGTRVSELVDAFAQNGTVEIDTSELDECDIATVQLLVAVAHTAKGTNRTLEMRAPAGKALVDFLEDLGLRPEPGEVDTGRAKVWSAYFE